MYIISYAAFSVLFHDGDGNYMLMTLTLMLFLAVMMMKVTFSLFSCSPANHWSEVYPFSPQPAVTYVSYV